MYLAIDPGEHAGWAVLNAQKQLISCGIGKAPRPAKAYAIVLCERPTIYPYSKASPSNIVTLAITAGKLVAPFEADGSQLEWVEPRTWKGQINKQAHHAAIMYALTPHEQAVVAGCLDGVRPKLREDAMDAVGLAAYGRRMHVFR